MTNFSENFQIGTTGQPDGPVPPVPSRVRRTQQAAAAALGDPAERAHLDDIVGRAAGLLPSGSAQISLLADAQLVVSVVPGAELDRPPAAAAGEQWPFEETVCALALRTDAEVRIPDATADERVSSLGSVENGDVGNYLGSPIRDRNGDLFGVLCLYGPGTHDWTDAEAAQLAEHAGALADRLQRLADRDIPGQA